MTNVRDLSREDLEKRVSEAHEAIGGIREQLEENGRTIGEIRQLVADLDVRLTS